MEGIDDIEHIASDHDQLISVISKLDKTQHIIEPTRNEPTNINSEFNLIKKSNKSILKNVSNILSDTASHVEITKKLLKSQEESKVLSKPLEKPQVERIKRATGYLETKKKVGRWDPIVARSRTVDQVFFPLKKAENRLQPTQAFISKLKTKSELERELEAVDPPDIVQEDDEEEQVYPMSYEEMVEHRQHLAKIRAQESYRAAKAKRQSKIKSKKYHRILKKDRLKQQLKEFEELQKSNPEEALKKLEALEKSRALERHTLRHKNTGKWAKNKMIRAKYDKEARQEIAEQLAVSRSLTQKTQDPDSSDDDAEDNVVIPDIALAQDPMNPWMLKQNNKSNVDAEFDFGYKKYLKGKMFKHKEDSGSEDEAEKNNDTTKACSDAGLNTLKNKIEKIFNNKNESAQIDKNIEEDNSTEQNQSDLNQPIQNNSNITKNKIVETEQKQKENKMKKNKETLINNKKSLKTKLVATSYWTVEPVENKDKKYTEGVGGAFDNLERNISKQVNMKLDIFRRKLRKLEQLTASKSKKKSKRIGNSESYIPENNLEYLKLATQNKKAIIDEQLLETTSKTIPTEETISDDIMSRAMLHNKIPAEEPTNSNIDPSKFIEVKPKFLNSEISRQETELDVLDDEQVVPKVNIEEVFEEDDVVASFRQEKQDEANKDKPEDINLTLPGWGAWGGKGVKAPKRKRNRFITKFAPKTPRRDENKGDVIIKEYKDLKLDAHKVKELPYPFNSVKEFEASLRAPLGNTFIPETAHRKLTRPNVVTMAGAIIEPMDEDELLQKKNRIFKSSNVIQFINKDG